MSSSVNPVDSLLARWLDHRLNPEQRLWLRETCQATAAAQQTKFYLAFGGMGRKLGREPLALDVSDQAAADEARPGWQPRDWTVDQAARTQLILALPSDDLDAFSGVLDRLHAAASVEEQIALAQALPVLPGPERHHERAVDLLRTNIPAVFTAVAHGNPYPAEQFSALEFWHMILKALFIGQRLDPIVGLDERAGVGLTEMLLGFAAERRAAGRSIPVELWRLVALAPQAGAESELRRLLTDATDHERRAAQLALDTIASRTMTAEQRSAWSNLG